MAKLVRMEGVDRISNLPDAVLGHILSFVSTKQTVRTSILSTRWRYLFALVSNLDFEFDEDERRCDENTESGEAKSFMCFVDRVLFYRNTNIEKFCLKGGHFVDTSRVYGWLSAALWRGVQHLALSIVIGRFSTLTLPHVLYTCRTLVTLNLGIRFALNVPNHVCFPNLKTLRLQLITFLDDDSVERLFSGCINLEEMIMKDCSLDNISKISISNHSLKRLTIDCSGHNCTDVWMVIDAPMLVHFQYRAVRTVCGRYSLKMPSLVSADLYGVLLADEPDEVAFFRGISNVQSLTMTPHNLEVLLSCESVPVFANLVQLEICCFSVESWYYDLFEKGHPTLLRNSPELCDLDFFQEVDKYLPEKVHSSLLSNVKEIEMSDFEEGDEECMAMAKYFLKNAGILEKLRISTLDSNQNVISKISEELLASPRTLKQCCISVSRRVARNILAF